MRATMKECEAVCAMINNAVGFEDDTKLWNRVDNRNVATLGMYYISGQYGGYSLEYIVTEGGGVTTVFGTCTKRELIMQMRAWLAGYYTNKKGQ